MSSSLQHTIKRRKIPQNPFAVKSKVLTHKASTPTARKDVDKRVNELSDAQAQQHTSSPTFVKEKKNAKPTKKIQLALKYSSHSLKTKKRADKKIIKQMKL